MDLEIPYAPHKRQRPFHSSNAKFRAFITGVGCGKSAAGANEIIKMSLEYPKSIFIIMAPTFRMLKHAALVEFFKWCPKPLIKWHKRGDREIWLVGREVPIIYLSADNERHIDRLRGMTIGGFWLDEGAMFLRLVWDVILARLRCPHGPLSGIITTTPRGFGWPYYYFVRNQNPRTKKKLRNADAYEWFSGSTLDNPYTPDEYKQNLLDTYSGKFAKQEIYGEFTGFEGLVFNNFSRNTHIVDTAPEMQEYIISFDWGFTNPTAGLVIGFDYDGRAYVVEEYYKTKTPIEDAVDWSKKMWLKYNVLRAYGDPSSPDHLYKFNSAGLTMTGANNAVLPGINTVYNYFEVRDDGKPRLFILRKCQNLIDELEEYRYKEMTDERPQREDHFEGKDHLCDALRYALHTHKPGDKGFLLLDDPEGLVF